MTLRKHTRSKCIFRPYSVQASALWHETFSYLHTSSQWNQAKENLAADIKKE